MKNENAVALGRLGGLRGGPARARSLSPERRAEVARRAAGARWEGERRIARRRRAAEISGATGADPGVVEGVLLARERLPAERLARGLQRGRWLGAGG